jgi:hypothetical protein
MDAFNAPSANAVLNRGTSYVRLDCSPAATILLMAQFQI